ncbi:MAG: hypothetical protein HIU81_06895 [Acidobacteria bacterium]|nr:hypothetical protein [Acidobacteriota bacterium]
MGFSISHAAMRLTTGAFILNSGIGKLGLDTEHAQGMQEMAGRAIPQVKSLEPARFGQLLSYGEITLGAALLAPFVPSRLAGLGLAAFSSGLVATYLKTPGATLDDGIRPSHTGVPMAKDIWMLGIAVALILDRKRK